MEELTAVKVAFRMENRGGVRDVLAVIEDGEGAQGLKTCYAHVGQHSTCSMWYYRDSTRPATPEEYAPLLQELQGLGYDVTPVKRLRWQY